MYIYIYMYVYIYTYIYIHIYIYEPDALKQAARLEASNAELRSKLDHVQVRLYICRPIFIYIDR